MTDVLALTTKIARLLDPISLEDRTAVFNLLHDRYQIGPLQGALRMARWRRARDETVTLFGPTGDDTVTPQGGESVTPPPQTPPTPRVFEVPESIRMALRKCSFLGSKAVLWRPSFWQAAIRAYPGLDYAQVVFAAEAYVQTKPAARPRTRFGTFMLHQLERAAERAE